MKISFVLTGEGSSDLNLVDHIEGILIELGFEEASGQVPDLGALPRPIGHAVQEKLKVLVELYPNTNIIFVHRDADNTGYDARREEISKASADITDTIKVIPIIPVKELETWLLADESSIKSVAGNPDYRGSLDMVPAPRNLETLADAKGVLLAALCEASETQGGRLRKFKKRFSEMRARLVYDLDPNGPVRTLQSYAKFREALEEYSRIALAE